MPTLAHRVTALLICGAVLLGIAGLWVIGDWDRLSERMPTQVPPRRAAWLPFLAGAVLIVMGLAIGASRGI